MNGVLSFLMDNGKAILIVVGLGLGVVVAVLKLAKKDAAADSVKKVEDVVDQLDGQSPPKP